MKEKTGYIITAVIIKILFSTNHLKHEKLVRQESKNHRNFAKL
jgi:hypothetical protein